MRFALNDQYVDLALPAPDRTLLELLRLDLGHCGTKEGCASGDCGACTVLVSEPDADAPGAPAADGAAAGAAASYRSVNACIAPAAAVAGRHVITVEGLARDGVLHPAQRAMVEQHGSQCGFCTPGFVMSLAALHDRLRQGVEADRHTVLEAISGNLCRCTGYRPIIAAAEHMTSLPDSGPLHAMRPTPAPVAARSPAATHAPDATDAGHSGTGAQAAGEPLDRCPGECPGYARPIDAAGLRHALEAHPQARLIAGGTDLMLEHTQQYRDLPALIDVRDVRELNVVESTATHWRLGAAVPLTDLLALFRAELPPLAALLERFGSPQIRNRGSLGGNLGTGSPIGDLSPVLQALGAELRLGHVDGSERTVSVDAFHLDYRRTALAAGEYIIEAIIPKPDAADIVAIRKYSKRHEDDISSVLGAACVRWQPDHPAATVPAVNGPASGGRTADTCRVRVAFGGVAATPLRIPAIEALLEAYAADRAADRVTDPGTHRAAERAVERAADETAASAATDPRFERLTHELHAALAAAITPLTDVRASAAYRMAMAQAFVLDLARTLRAPNDAPAAPGTAEPQPGSARPGGDRP